jgi:tripartite-type tricarboxylate transporter receptor subunit TctC
MKFERSNSTILHCREASMRLLTCCALALFSLLAASAQAADYPERNITVIVPFPAGGASDMTARLVTPKLAERVKQSVVVDNRAGANGSLGATAMKLVPR